MAEVSEAEENGKLQLLRISLRTHFRTFASTVSQKKFLELYENVIKQNRKAKGRKLYALFQDLLVQTMTDNLDQFFKESNIDKKLNEAEKALNNCIVIENGEAWRPPSNVEAHMRSYDVCDQECITQEYEDFLQRKDATVLCSKNYILTKRTEIENIRRAVASLKHDIETLSSVHDVLVPGIESSTESLSNS